VNLFEFNLFLLDLTIFLNLTLFNYKNILKMDKDN